MKKIFLIILVSMAMVGCARVSFAPSKAGYTPQQIVSPDQVEVYRSNKPQKSYTEIGSLHYPSSGDLDSIINMMKVEAAKQGGDAIVDLQVNSIGVVGTVVKLNK